VSTAQGFLNIEATVQLVTSDGRKDVRTDIWTSAIY